MRFPFCFQTSLSLTSARRRASLVRQCIFTTTASFHQPTTTNNAPVSSRPPIVTTLLHWGSKPWMSASTVMTAYRIAHPRAELSWLVRMKGRSSSARRGSFSMGLRIFTSARRMEWCFICSREPGSFRPKSGWKWRVSMMNNTLCYHGNLIWPRGIDLRSHKMLELSLISGS